MVTRVILRCGVLWIVTGLVFGCGRRSEPVPQREPESIGVSAAIDPIVAARESLQRGEFAAASRIVAGVLDTDPDNPAALELAGDLSARGGDVTKSVGFYRLAVAANETPSKHLLNQLGQQYVNAGRPFDSVELMELAVERYPDDPELRRKLVGLQAALGIQWEAADNLQWLVQRGHGGLDLLVILSDLNRPQTVESTCRYALDHFPEDLRPKFSLACLPAYHSQWAEVAEQLRPVVERHPRFIPAQAFYGRALVELGDQTRIQQWSESRPAQTEAHPQYWLAAGIWAEKRNDHSRAAKSFWRAAQLNENDSEALNRLAASLAQLGQTERAKSAARRAAKMVVLRDDVDSLLSWRNDSQSAAVKIARTLNDLGRTWEATAWLQSAFRMTRNEDPGLAELYQSIRSTLTGDTPWQRPELLVAAKMDLSDLPDLDWQPSIAPATSQTFAASAGQIQFGEQAAQRQLHHVCRLSKPPGEEAGLAIYQSGAGGAGIIDFDLDGWPDVYLTTMDGQPKQYDSGPNSMFRNLAGRFAKVTDPSGVADAGFAQGIAVGDYNADGLPDLFVANIGRNTLFRNNGDGTFADVSDDVGLHGDEWTTSAAIVDVDNDGNADLFQVGYCGGEQPYRQPCIDSELQQARSCSPGAFDAQCDRVLRGRGDGTFVDTTNHWLGEHDCGRGLGLVVGQFDQQAGLDVYVANDMTANHLWCSETDPDGNFRLSEQATLRGLAFNQRSLSQASMGIAAADADNDGDVDFLVTHFSGDYNTFYEQTTAGIWADRSNRVGLAAPSHRMLGYGTQWIDADNDGSPELLVANGDIDDFTHKDRLFRQRPQFFDRGSDGRWIGLNCETLGSYFCQDRLARAVVTWDANRDGRTDLLVTHLFDPVAVLVNESETRFGRIRFFIRATRGHPDAIGTQVTIEVDHSKQTQQLFAGDGFQCSQERCLSFGVGDANRAENVTVLWPDGSSEKFGSVGRGKDYLLVEGSGTAFPLTP